MDAAEDLGEKFNYTERHNTKFAFYNVKGEFLFHLFYVSSRIFLNNELFAESLLGAPHSQ